MTQAIILRRKRLGKTSTNGIQQFSETGIKAVRNWVRRDWPERHNESGTMTIFRWGCTSSIFPQPAAVNIVNKAPSIHWCADKKKGRLDMQEAGVPVPQTWGSFQAYADHDYWRRPVVLRPSRHSQGRNLFVFNPSEDTADGDRLFAKTQELGSYYISELIDKEHEYRVFVCQNRVVWVAKKTPGNPQDVAWNVACGGRFDNVRWGSWPMPAVIAALKAAKVSGTDFCGVDVMVDYEGRPYVLEVNSAPSQTSEYRQKCVAKAFDYIVRNGVQHFPDTNYNQWQDVIHPAVRGDND